MEKKYQVFISSTFVDLKEARMRVRDAILSMYHFPVGMELFGAANEEQWQIISETIDSSDYYVLIIGQRYGTIVESGKDIGISYTEKEFRYAREKNIPILAFILDDNIPVMPEHVEQDNRERLIAFKEEVKRERMVEWWTSPNDLAQRVTTALYHQINRTKRPGWIRGDTFDIEKSLAEIVALSDRNRVLEDVNKSLLVENQKLKLRPERNPELIVSFSADTDANNKDDPLYGREKCISTDDAMRIHLTVGYVDTQKIESNYQPISKGDFIGELHERVTDEEIQKYNASLPSKETVKSYAKEYRHYHMIVDHGIASVITIHNVGTAKATDVSASLEFPEEIQVYSIDDVREIEEPEAPSKPRSLQRVAYERAHKTEIALERACTQLATPFTGSTYSWPSISNAVLGNTAIESVEVIDNTVEIETKHSIVHTKCYWFDGIYLVPMRKGVYEAKLTIMCAEYENPDENTITFVCE